MNTDFISTFQRTLTIPRFSRAPATGVWYYHVDITVLNPVPNADDGPLPSAVYSILRRYNDFLELYDKIQEILVLTKLSDATIGPSAMPAFPEKETISPGLFGSLMRLSTPRAVLELRRTRFQKLLQWIEYHPVARMSTAFVEFLGQPPQVQDGYTSLKEYAAPHWLKAVQHAAAKGKEKEKEKEKQQLLRRGRAYTMDTLEGRRGSVSSNASSVKSEPPRRSPPLAMTVVSGPAARDEEEILAVLGKRRGSVPVDRDAVKTEDVAAAADDDEEEPKGEPMPGEKEAVARPEGAARPQRKKSRILYAELPPWRRECRP